MLTGNYYFFQQKKINKKNFSDEILFWGFF